MERSRYYCTIGHEIKKAFLSHFEKLAFSTTDIEIIIDLLKHDKKNTHGNINFVLLPEIGATTLDVKVQKLEKHKNNCLYFWR